MGPRKYERKIWDRHRQPTRRGTENQESSQTRIKRRRKTEQDRKGMDKKTNEKRNKSGVPQKGERQKRGSGQTWTRG